jgi:hypothetical protein
MKSRPHGRLYSIGCTMFVKRRKKLEIGLHQSDLLDGSTSFVYDLSSLAT